MAQKFLTSEQEKVIVAAIARAEEGNRGEVRVHIEKKCKGDALARAAGVFAALGMAETAADTGLLLYIARASRKVAIFAGKGIHEAVEGDTWQELVDRVARSCGQGQQVDGICQAIDTIGELLRQHLPGEDTAGDELPNQVTTA